MQKMLKKIIKWVYFRARSIIIFNRTMSLFASKQSISESRRGNILIRGCDKKDLPALKVIYEELNGRPLSEYHSKLYERLGGKLVFLSIKKDQSPERIVGINIYYLNPRDFKENTVHEGFIGVCKEEEGQGIATDMRKAAIAHFKQLGFTGISSRISKNNAGSLRSAEKLGFKIVEEYFDDSMKEERFYLICSFGEKHDP